MTYLALPVKLALALALLTSLTALAGETELGAVMPEGSRKVAEHRFRSSRDWTGTWKFYNEVYPAKEFPRKAIVNQPGVKAVHLANPSGKAKWEGLNIYESNDEVRIYVVPADGTGIKKKVVPPKK